MNVDRLRDALANNRPVWVEIKNERSTSDIYTPGKSLVAGTSSLSHRLMLDPAAGDPVIQLKAAGANGQFTCLSTVAENRQLVRYRRGKVYLILLKDDVHFEVPLQPLKDKFGRQILEFKDGPHYPFARNLSLVENGYLKKATSGLVELFIRALAHAPTLGEAVYPRTLPRSIHEKTFLTPLNKRWWRRVLDKEGFGGRWTNSGGLAVRFVDSLPENSFGHRTSRSGVKARISNA